nr:DNA-directed DNA polymerase I [Candidatus Njordarchaeum guaymaensis]
MTGIQWASGDDYVDLGGDTPTLDNYFRPTASTEKEYAPDEDSGGRKRREGEDELVADLTEEDLGYEPEEEEAELKLEGIRGQRYVLNNTPPSVLLSVRYDGDSRKAFVKLYDSEKKQLYFWYDDTGHLPYCFTDISPQSIRGNRRDIMNHPGFKDLETVDKYDLLLDRKAKVTKIVASDPLAIGGRNDSIRELIPDNVWEAKIPYHICYIYDRGLTPGMSYRVKDGKLLTVDTKIQSGVLRDFTEIFKDEPKEFKELIPRLLPYFIEPTPDIRRVAVDIEVHTPIADRIPDPTKAEHEVFAVSLASNDGLKEVYLLKNEKQANEYQALTNSSGSREFEVRLFDSEVKLIEKTFGVLDEYPLVVTFNGDLFDLRYLAHRARKLNVDLAKIPIILTRQRAALRYGEHIDLYQFFFNRSIQVYAFSNKYRDVSLDTISRALLGEGKLELTKPIIQLSPQELVQYSWQDAKITFNLTHFNGNIVLNLILLIMRLSHLPIEDVTRQAVSAWIRSLFYFEHRAQGYLIPRPQDISKLKGQADTKALIKGKKYLGAIVVEPRKGVHFNVAVLDFASLYPSIIKTKNLSYETVRCPHQECKGNKIPETTHWVCIKKRGISSLLIGFLRDTRVRWFKIKAKDKSLNSDERSLYDAVSQALKVFLNASYGVFGAETFPLYCPPVAESTTAVGRYAIKKTIDKAKEIGVEVIYGDSLAYDRKIFVQTPEGDVWLQQIGEFVDRHMDQAGRYRTLAYENEMTKFQPIIRLIRHKYNGQMLRIVTQHGRTVVTPQHSIYAYKDGKIELCDAKELRKGDLLISLTNPIIESMHDEKYVFDLAKLNWGRYKNSVMLWKDNLRFPREKGLCPYCNRRVVCLSSHIHYAHSERRLTLFSNVDWRFIGGRNAKSERIPRFIKLTTDLAWILGFYCAEGSTSDVKTTSGRKYILSFAGQNRRYIERIKVYFDELLTKNLKIIENTDKRTGKPIYYYRISGIPVIALFSEAFGCGIRSSGKRVPNFILSSEESLRRAFIEGYFAGDGYTVLAPGYRTIFPEFATKSLDLAIGVQLILKSLDFGKTKFGKQLKHLYWKRRKDKPGVVQVRLQGAKSNEKEGENFCLTRITDIRRMKYRHPYVYDIEVEGAHNFVDAEGMILVHNTDSVFLKNPSEAQIKELFKWSAVELGIELELDKRYRYLALSERKKNYLGVYEDGTVDIKGLTGKKRNTPGFLKQAFQEMVQALAQVHSSEDFDLARKRIKEIARTCYRKLEKREYSLDNLAFRIELTKALEDYKKTTPQHVKAAKQLQEDGAEVKAGDIIYFVKVKGPAGVKPVKQASVNEIDVEKYKDHIKTTFEQVLDALGIEFHEIMGFSKLDAFY